VAIRIQGRVDPPWRFFSIAIVLVIATLFYTDWRAFQQSGRKADQTRDLMKQTDSLLSSIRDAETAERGYLLTGDRKYLDPWLVAARTLPAQLDQLTRALRTVRPANAQLADQIRVLALEKLKEIRETVGARDSGGLDAALAIVQTNEGKLTMDELRADCALLVSGEYLSLYQETNLAQTSANRFRVVVVVGCLGLIILLFRLGTAVDTVVGEREEFAKSVEQARQLLETTLASIGDAVIVSDSSGKVRFMNELASRLTGWSAQEAAGAELDSVFSVVSQHTGKVMPSPTRLLESNSKGTSPKGETLLLKPRGGGALPIEDSIAPLRDSSTSTPGLVLAFRDISARRIAENELERWKRIFSGAGFGMFVLNPADQTLIDMNATFAAMHGYSVEELRGRSLADLAAPVSRPDLGSLLRIAREKGRHLFEQQHLKRDGTQFPALIDLTTFPDRAQSSGELWWAGYCSDNTERKQYEDNLREREERFRTLASALPQLIWATDAAGQLEYVNPVWTAYAGAASGGNPWKNLIHPEEADAFFERWNHSLSSGETFEMQARMRRAEDSSWRWFLCRGVAVRDRSGKIIRWLGGCTDVQQQVVGALQLKQANQALERSNADLEQFAYAASHDLQEPLRMVSIYTQLLKEEYGGSLNNQATEWIDFAVNGAQRMSNLLKGLLAYSRVTNAVPENTGPGDTAQALRTALLNLASAVEQSGAEIVAGDLPRVPVPEVHLAQLFQNLIANAIKYSRPGVPPHIRICVDRAVSGHWLFAVHDNGIGIEAEYLTQIFGVFKRLHGQSVEGTGIGLASCQKIIERAGGHIWAESQPGAGSTFYFTLPAVKAANA
jgi:PAS domain S-box-containing protein